MPLYGDYANYAGTYGGVKVEHPEIGSWVIVKVGPYTDTIFRVESLRGHAYHHFYRVYVVKPDGGGVGDLWYWPWEVEEWEEPPLREFLDSQ